MGKDKPYSLTARERKEKRRAEQEKKRDKNLSKRTEKEDAFVVVERDFAKTQKLCKNNAIIVFVSVILAIVLFSTAVLVPLILYKVNPYIDMKNPVAVFRLSNGMELEFEIDETNYVIGATNFIFLARNGFFDGTIFFDAQDSWVRFGGYESVSSDRTDSVEYCNSFKAIPISLFGDDNPSALNKFGYGLKSDNGSNNSGGNDGTNTNLLSDIGVLAFLYSDSATDFQICAGDGGHSNVVQTVSGGTQTFEPSMIGRALDDTTIENIKSIYGTAADTSPVTTGVKWLPPTPNIRINKVTVYNLDNSKWRNFDFYDYMNRKNSYVRSWTGVA